MKDKDERADPRRLLRPGEAIRIPGEVGPHQTPGLTARLQGDLGRSRTDRPEIGEQSMVGAFLELAVRGNPRAVQDIWTRIEGRPGERPETPPFTIDDETARKILAI